MGPREFWEISKDLNSDDDEELYDPNFKNFEKNIQNLVGLDKNPKIEIDEETGENPIEDFDPGFDVLLLVESGNKLKETTALLTYYGVDFNKIKLKNNYYVKIFKSYIK